MIKAARNLTLFKLPSHGINLTRLRGIILIILVASLAANLSAQNDNVRFDRLGIEQGLYNSKVNCILQDSQGFMWFGTREGLNKFDGYKFTIYHHNPENSNSLGNNSVISIFEDSGGSLWIGTWEGGLNKFDRKTETFTRFQHRADDPQSLSDNIVRPIFEDSTGSLWIGTFGGGLNKFDRNTRTFTRFKNQPDNSKSLSHNAVSCILEDSFSDLWVGTWSGGLNKLDRNTGTFTRFKNKSDNPHSLSHNRVYSIFEDSTGSLWIGTKDGLNKFDRKTGIFTRYLHQAENTNSLSNNMVWSIFEDSTGSLWIGTLGGLNKFDRNEGTFTRFLNQPGKQRSLSHNSISSLYEDSSGNLWIGTMNGGINKLDWRQERFTHYQHSADNAHNLIYNDVWSIFEDEGGDLWIGTWGGGLNKFDRKTGIFSYFKHRPDDPNSLSDNFVTSIFQDSTGSLWIGTYRNGINKFDKKTETFTRFLHQSGNPHSLSSSMVFSIFEDSTGSMWIGTLEGLNKFDRKTGTFTCFSHQVGNPKSLSNNHINTIFEDSTGSLWIGTLGGLNKFDRKTETFTRFQHQGDNPQSLSHNTVRPIFEDSTSNLWIGTTSGGLNKFDRKEEKFTHFLEQDGLLHNTVYGILGDDQGNLWLSTGKGISKFNPGSGTFTNYDKKDGLQSNQFNIGAYHQGKSGRMYFGGPEGFNEFYPENIRDNKNTNIPPVVITDFLLFNKPVPIARPGSKGSGFRLQQHINFTREITLDYRENMITLEFSALNYRQSEKNQFAYKLEGFDNAWIKTGYKNRRATYTDLPPGSYTFRVKASNDDGIWNEQGASLKIRILQPAWNTWWFKSLVVIFTLAFFYSLYRLRISRIKVRLERTRLERIVKERTREISGKNLQLKEQSEKLKEMDRVKSRFFANISHEFRTPLTLIMGPLEQMVSSCTDEAEQKKITMMLRNSRCLLNLINQLLDLSKFESGRMRLNASRQNIVPFLKGVVHSFDSLTTQNQITLSFHCTWEEISLFFDPEKVEKAVFNLLINAVKYTPPGGSISVTLRTKDDPAPGLLEISVKDTGIGIPADKVKHIFDRFYQAEGLTGYSHKGSGIGLALTKELVELHHGEITVQSQEGKGSEFFIRLPLGDSHLRAEEMADQESELAEPTIHVDAPDLYSEDEAVTVAETADPEEALAVEKDIILLVEDNADVRAYIKGPLESQYRVVEAKDGEEGIRRARELIPDLIISDIMMPKVDGYELCKDLKEDIATSHIPIILLTAKASEESVVEGLQTGADDYITKPFSTKILCARIRNLIDLRRDLQERMQRQMILQPTRLALSRIDKSFIKKLHEVITKELSNPDFNVDLLSRKLKLNRSTLYRKIQALSGENPTQFIRSLRLKKGAELLRSGFGTVLEVALEVGFSSSAYFIKCFKEKFHQLPGEYQAASRG